jgi:tetratricopeptide (TPR) repeat protein
LYRQAQALQERLTLEQPEVARHQEELGKTCINIGVVFGRQGKWAQAVPAFRQALETQRRLVAERPDVPGYQSQLAMTGTNLGSVYQLTRRMGEARDAYRQADEVWAALVKKHPDIVAYKLNWAGMKGNIGELLRDTGKAEESLAWFGKTLDLLGEVRAAEPKHPYALQFLVNTYQGRAEALKRLGRTEEALRDWDSALKLAPEPRRALLRAGRLATQVRAGYSPQVVQQAAELTRTPKLSDQTLYTLAGVYSVAAGAVLKDGQTPSAERDALAGQYAGTAVQLLRKARQAGWFNDPTRVSLLMEDEDFAPLRGQAAFRKFLAELEKAPSP